MRREKRERRDESERGRRDEGLCAHREKTSNNSSTPPLRNLGVPGVAGRDLDDETAPTGVVEKGSLAGPPACTSLDDEEAGGVYEAR